MNARVKLLELLLAAFGAVGCLGPMEGIFPPAAGEPTVTVYVVDHGWHMGLVVPTDTLPVAVVPPWEAARRSPYLEIGWGDDGYYRAKDVNWFMAVRAMLWCNPSVLHIVALDKTPEAAFSTSGVIRIMLSMKGFYRLSSFLADAYAYGEDGKPVDLGKGLYGTSRFYRSTEYYYFPNTCNKWTARALRAAGAPITPFYAIRAGNVFDQCKKFGVVVRESADQ